MEGISLAAALGGMLAGCDPQPPQGLRAHALSSTEVELSWLEVGGNVDGIVIGRRLAGDEYGEVARVAPNSTSYRNSEVREGESYSYRLQTYVGERTSAPSTEIEVETSSEPPVITDFSLVSDSLTSDPEIRFNLKAFDDTGVTGWLVSKSKTTPDHEVANVRTTWGGVAHGHDQPAVVCIPVLGPIAGEPERKLQRIRPGSSLVV